LGVPQQNIEARTALPRQEPSQYTAVNSIKANFDAIYRQQDPRDYYLALGNLDYVIPEIASPVFLQLASQLRARKGRPITVLDVGCSYGVLSAIMRHGLTMDQLRERYASPSIRRLSPGGLTACDANFFAGWPEHADIRFIGLDASPDAIAYARLVGLIDEGLAVNLETGTLSEQARDMISKADLIVSSGAVGYVTEKTFSKLLSAFEPGHEPWVASFVLRVFDYKPLSLCMAERGLVTERFEGATFVQRRFRDWAEYENMIRLLHDAGIDPAGKEAEGLLHAELFVSRPELEIRNVSLSKIVSLSNGSSAPQFHHRFRLGSTACPGLAA
jgi:SAM-dependent methyltransferase